jgi:unsaturated chondroitin disaccharide hydrolase
MHPRAGSYRDYALQILDTLTEPEFLACDTPGWEGILKHGIYHLPQGAGVDESVIWGDYYLLEGLSMALSQA